MKTNLHVYKMEQQCSVISNLTPTLSLTWSRQYNGLVSLCTTCLSVHVAVNQVPKTTDLTCELQPNVRPTIMNMECPDYSEMQVCLQLRFRQNPQNVKSYNVHYYICTMYTTVKTSLQSFSAQVFHSRKKVDVNTRCSPTTLQPRKPKHKSPHQNYTATMSTQLFWHTVHAQYAGPK